MNAYQRKGEEVAACFLRRRLGKDVTKKILAINKIPKPGKLKKVSKAFAFTMEHKIYTNIIIQFPGIAPCSTFIR
jgi:hypothetical protein